MLHTGKCPSCSKMVTHLEIQPVEIRQGFNVTYHGVSYQCPFCKAILGAGVDPLALKTDTINGILRGLGKKVR